jgi:hypothetical protein
VARLEASGTLVTKTGASLLPNTFGRREALKSRRREDLKTCFCPV